MPAMCGRQVICPTAFAKNAFAMNAWREVSRGKHDETLHDFIMTKINVPPLHYFLSLKQKIYFFKSAANGL